MENLHFIQRDKDGFAIDESLDEMCENSPFLCPILDNCMGSDTTAIDAALDYLLTKNK